MFVIPPLKQWNKKCWAGTSRLTAPLVARSRLTAHFSWLLVLLLALCWNSLRAAETAAPTIAGDYSRGLLWKIEKGDQPTSYLFGTVHAEDPAVLSLPPDVGAAFQGSRAFAMEVLLDANMAREATRAMFYRDGKKNLKTVAGESLYKRVVAAVTQRGMAEDHVLYMKPWAVMTTLSMPEAKTGLFLDLALLKVATADGKAVFGLESLQEQMGVFEEMPDTDQLELLEKTLNELPTFDAYIADIIKAYLARDLVELARLTDSFLEELTPKVANEFRRRLITDRNLRMVERLEPIMARQSTFAAVGAMHLPGAQGMLDLLAARGYRVSRVY